jgi:hypothetical protein
LTAIQLGRAARVRAWPTAVVVWPLFAAVFLAGMVGRALVKPLWHDEIFTLYLATRTTVDGLWAALAGGVDLNPPLYYLAVRACAAVVGAGALADRLPSLVGYAAAVVAVAVVAGHHAGRRGQLFAALTLVLTGASVYAYEGRAYGLVLGLSALALAAWQARGRGASWMAAALCALSLAAATCAHYYAVLMLAPIAAAEAVRSVERRRIDWVMWPALGASLLPLLALYPLVHTARTFAPAFWSPPSLNDLADSYRLLLEPLAIPVFAAGIAATLVGRLTRHADAPDVTPIEPRSLRYDELAAVLALVAVPVLGYVVGRVATGAFHERYVLQAALGVAILAAWWGAALIRSRRAELAVVAVLLLAFAARQAGGAVSLVRSAPDPLGARRHVVSPNQPREPVVVSHALAFVPMVHYASSDARHGLVYLTRPADVVRQIGGDTAGRALTLLSRVTPMDVEPYDTFVAAHQRFYVFGPKSWLVPKLLRDGASIELLREEGDDALYLVSANGRYSR